jgi:hypothetical protein
MWHIFQEDNQAMTVLAVGGLLVIVAVALVAKAYRIRQQTAEKTKVS